MMKKLLTIVFLLISFAVFAEENIQDKIDKLQAKLDALEEITPVFFYGNPYTIKGFTKELRGSKQYQAYPKFKDKVYINRVAYQTRNAYASDDLYEKIEEAQDKINDKISDLKNNKSKISSGRTSSSTAGKIRAIEKRIDELNEEKSDLSSKLSKYKSGLSKYNAKASSAKTIISTQIHSLESKLYSNGDTDSIQNSVLGKLD